MAGMGSYWLLNSTHEMWLKFNALLASLGQWFADQIFGKNGNQKQLTANDSTNYIQQNTNINDVYRKIVYAIRQGNFNDVKFLINVKNKFGYPPIHTAVKLGDKDVVSVLLMSQNNGWNINNKIAKDDTLLCLALKWGYLDIAKILLDNGAGKHDYGAFYVAVSKGYAAIVQELLNFECQIDVNNEFCYQTTALIIAVLIQNDKIINILLQKSANVNTKNENGESVLHLSVKNNNIKYAKQFLEKGANVNIKNVIGNTVLYEAIYTGNENIVNLLLENDADINCENLHGNSVLHVSIYYENICKLLLNRGINVDAKNDLGNTALYLSVQNNLKNIVNLLLEYNANVNCSNNEGESALHIAVKQNHVKLCYLLLKKGANINAKTKYGETALSLANSTKIINILKNTTQI